MNNKDRLLASAKQALLSRLHKYQAMNHLTKSRFTYSINY